MVERFIKLKQCIPKALRVIRSTETITSKEWDILEDISNTLRPFEIALKGLCSRDATLLNAEISIKFILKKLSEQNTNLTVDLKESLSHYYSSRRQKETIGLLHYLHNPEILKAQHDELFSIPSKIVLKRVAERIFKRIFPEDEGQLVENEGLDQNEDTSCCIENMDKIDDPMVAEYMQDIEQLEKIPLKIKSCAFNPSTEFKSFEVSLKRTENLDKLYNALLSIRPTSVESERAFSAAGLYLTKLRSSLSENSLNSLCFLKTFFQNNE